MRHLSLTVVFVVALARIAAGQNLVVGGDFESPVIPTGSPYLLDATPTGWVGTGDLTAQGYAGSVPSGNGSQWLDLNPDTSAGTGIYQSITLAAGTEYSFSFLYNGGGGGTTTEIAYSLSSSSGTLLSGSVSTAALNVYSGSPWSVFSTDVTPSTSGPETLRFTPNGVWSGGFIDAVSVTPVPEPTSLALIGAGAAGLFAYVWRRRTKATDARD